MRFDTLSKGDGDRFFESETVEFSVRVISSVAYSQLCIDQISLTVTFQLWCSQSDPCERTL